MKIIRQIPEHLGNIVESQAKSSALEINNSHLKQNRAPRDHQSAPYTKSNPRIAPRRKSNPILQFVIF